MTSILRSKYRSLILFFVTCVIAPLSYSVVAYTVGYLNGLPKEAEMLKLQHLLTLISLATCAYCSTSATVCSAILIFRDLKPIGKEGLIDMFIGVLLLVLVFTLIVMAIDVSMGWLSIVWLIAGFIIGLVNGLVLELER